MKPVKDLPQSLSTRVGGTRYLWCEECHRAFTEDDVAIDDATFDKATMYAGGSPNLDRLAEAVMMRARCPYADCSVPLRTRPWTMVRAHGVDLPETPEAGAKYEEAETAADAAASGAAAADAAAADTSAPEGSC